MIHHANTYSNQTANFNRPGTSDNQNAGSLPDSTYQNSPIVNDTKNISIYEEENNHEDS